MIDRGHAVITKKWRRGDTIDVEFPLAVQKIKANDHVGADLGRVALRYGPLIYNVESGDQADHNVNRALAPTRRWPPSGTRICSTAWMSSREPSRTERR